MTIVLDALLWILALALVVGAGRRAWTAARLPALAPLPSDDQRRHPPSVSVIVAARNEQRHIGETVSSLLAQRGVDLEVILVDDRSTDETGRILRELSEEDPRLIPIRIDALPEGWLGKTHAMHTGARRARGEWLLFADADTRLKPDAIRRAVFDAEIERAPHYCLIPTLSARSTTARSALCLFMLAAFDLLMRVNADKPRAHFGVGAFNLIRTDLYRGFGGHEPLRMEVLDDLKLGLLVRRAGGATRVRWSGGAARTDWGAGLRSLVGVLEKNHFAVMRYNVALAIAATASLALIWSAALAGPVFFFTHGSIGGLAAGIGLISGGVPGAIIARRMGWPALPGLICPLLAPVAVWASVNSMVKTLINGGVNWRETFYPLRALREHMAR